MPLIKQLNTLVIIALTALFLLTFTGCSGRDEVLIFGTDDVKTEAEEKDPAETIIDMPDHDDSRNEVNGPDKTDSDSVIVVYVCGAVNSPGVVSIPVGSRVIDALELAGGFCDGANEIYVNLAASVNDGDQIYFPYEGEDDETIAGRTESGTEGQAGLNSGENYPININKADASMLCHIPGIGESKAIAIVSYRENNGRFSTVEDIKNVSGIGDALFEKIRDRICVD